MYIMSRSPPSYFRFDTLSPSAPTEHGKSDSEEQEKDVEDDVGVDGDGK